jgi:hypothetical protein
MVEQKTNGTIPHPPRQLTPAEEQLAQIMARIARRAKMRVKVRNPRRRANIKPARNKRA